MTARRLVGRAAEAETPLTLALDRLVAIQPLAGPYRFQRDAAADLGLFAAPPGTGTAGALRAAQLAQMDQADTSHPYYWSGFAIVGDGAVPVIRSSAIRAEDGN